MAITRVGLVTLAPATTTGWSCALPPGVQDGDAVVVFVTKRESTAPTPPAGEGYALLDPRDSSLTVFQWAYGAALTAADAGATHVWAWPSTTAGACGLVLRGVDAALLDVADPPAAGTANAAAVTCPATAVATAGAWVLWGTSHAVSVTHTFPATADGNAVTREAGGTAVLTGLARAEYGSAGAVAALSVTMGASGRCIGKTLVVKPAAAAGWTPATAQRWTGSAWQTATVRRWDGSAWVPATVQRRG
jgi:hypothetical protein